MNKELARYALQGLQAEMAKVEARLVELRQQQARLMKAAKASSKEVSEGASPSLETSRAVAVRKRRGMSAEGRERIRQAQTERWALQRAAQGVTAPTAESEVVDDGGEVAAPARPAPTRAGRTTGNRKR
jgi:hypothetical protein